MRRGDFSELLNPNNGFFTGARDHRSADRPAVPGQRHPGEPAVAERRGDPERLSAADARLPARAPPTLIQTSPNPQDQRKDNIRFDYRLNDSNQFTYRYSRLQLGRRSTRSAARSRSRAPTGIARTHADGELDEHAHEQPDQRATYTYSLDDVFINVFTETALYQRSRTGINYPYIFPEQGDRGQDPDDLDRNLPRDRRRSVSGVLVRARSTRSRTRRPG